MTNINFPPPSQISGPPSRGATAPPSFNGTHDDTALGNSPSTREDTSDGTQKNIENEGVRIPRHYRTIARSADVDGSKIYLEDCVEGIDFDRKTGIGSSRRGNDGLVVGDQTENLALCGQDSEYNRWVRKASPTFPALGLSQNNTGGSYNASSQIFRRPPIPSISPEEHYARTFGSACPQPLPPSSDFLGPARSGWDAGSTIVLPDGTSYNEEQRWMRGPPDDHDSTAGTSTHEASKTTNAYSPGNRTIGNPSGPGTFVPSYIAPSEYQQLPPRFLRRQGAVHTIHSDV